MCMPDRRYRPENAAWPFTSTTGILSVTLTDEEVTPWHNAIIQGLQDKFGAKLRA